MAVSDETIVEVFGVGCGTRYPQMTGGKIGTLKKKNYEKKGRASVSVSDRRGGEVQS